MNREDNLFNYFNTLYPAGRDVFYVTENIKFEDPLGIVRLSNSLREARNKYPVGPSGRPIAGSKRVARYREHHDVSPIGAGKLFQSITAHPGLANSSFEVRRRYCRGIPFVYYDRRC
jgi:hypothetical protein